MLGVSWLQFRCNSQRCRKTLIGVLARLSKKQRISALGVSQAVRALRSAKKFDIALRQGEYVDFWSLGQRQGQRFQGARKGGNMLLLREGEQSFAARSCQWL